MNAECLSVQSALRGKFFDDLEGGLIRGAATCIGSVLTVFSSPSLEGFGQVPGSKLIARKKLYAQRPIVIARVRWVNAWDCVSVTFSYT